MKTILIIMGRYLPGYKDGGPVRSIKNLVDRLGKEYNFRILTTDRDHGDDKPYQGIEVRKWNTVGAARVYYVEPGGFDESTVERLASESELVYMCGCFNDYARTTLKLKRQGRIKCRVVIAAMGLFSPGAFRIKYPKKKAYMVLLKRAGYFKNVEWSASSEEEAADIRREVGKDAVCHLAEDLPRKVEEAKLAESSPEGKLRIIFLSRISKKKNLAYAAGLLKDLQGQVVFDIYGNKEDASYWKECEDRLNKLPENISWNYKGEAPAEEVIHIFSQYDVFLFPTLAENYGHVILEAMSGGCIPVISDKTPWTVEKLGRSGNVVELEEAADFQKILQRYVDMGEAELREKREHCFLFSKKYLQEEAKKAENSYRSIFEKETDED